MATVDLFSDTLELQNLGSPTFEKDRSWDPKVEADALPLNANPFEFATTRKERLDARIAQLATEAGLSES